jgi:hypothetical protein
MILPEALEIRAPARSLEVVRIGGGRLGWFRQKFKKAETRFFQEGCPVGFLLQNALDWPGGKNRAN